VAGLISTIGAPFEAGVAPPPLAIRGPIAAIWALGRSPRRELKILTLVQRGRTNREIGAALGIEEKTLKNHINSMYSKLNISSRFEAMATAAKRP